MHLSLRRQKCQLFGEVLKDYVTFQMLAKKRESFSIKNVNNLDVQKIRKQCFYFTRN